MKLKILRRGGGGGGQTDASSKKKSSSRSKHQKNAPDANDIHATNTGSTASHSFDGSGGLISDVPHGSGIYVDTTRNNNNDGATGFLNDVVVAIKTPHKMSQQQNISILNKKKATTNKQSKPKGKTSVSASLPSLDFAEMLQAGYNAISCVAQCRPMSDATANAEIPTVIDPDLNEDNYTIGELTLITLEREEQRRELILAAKEKAAEISASFVGMGIASTTQQQPRVHANIGSLLDRNDMNGKAQALLEKANYHNHVVDMQQSGGDSVSFNMPRANADPFRIAKQAPTRESFVGRHGARPSLTVDVNDGGNSSGDENDCDSIDGQIGRW